MANLKGEDREGHDLTHKIPMVILIKNCLQIVSVAASLWMVQQRKFHAELQESRLDFLERMIIF